MRRDQPPGARATAGGFNCERDGHCEIVTEEDALHLQFDDLGLQSPAADDNLPYADRQMKPSRPSAPRIEIQHAILGLLNGNMAMPGNYCGESSCFRFEVKLMKVMKNVKSHASNLQYIRLRNLLRPTIAIDVASHRRHRSDIAQPVEYLRRPNVTGMHNKIRSL